MGVSPAEIRKAGETGLQTKDKCVPFGNITRAVPTGSTVRLLWSSGERSSQMTQTESTKV